MQAKDYQDVEIRCCNITVESILKGTLGVHLWLLSCIHYGVDSMMPDQRGRKEKHVKAAVTLARTRLVKGKWLSRAIPMGRL